MVSFRGSEDEILDDSMSLAPSEGEELSGSIDDPALPQSGESSEPKPGTDAELLRVLSRAVDDLGLGWSLLEEPSRSRLDEWFLLVHKSVPSSASFPHYSTCPRASSGQPSGARAPPVVDTDGDQGYGQMSPSWTHRSPPLACSNPLWKFTVAQKSSQATRHFLSKCSSSAAQSSFPRSAPTPQPAKTAPPATQPEPKPAPRDRSRSARHRPPPSATDPGPRLCWIQRPRCRPDLRNRKREGPGPIVAGRTRSVLGAEGNSFFAVTGPVEAPKQHTAAIADMIKHKHSQKESRFPLAHNSSGPSQHGDKSNPL